MSEPAPNPGSWRTWHSEDVPLQLGVSACLLGSSVRYDGTHSRDRFVTDTLGPFVRWKPVCPEDEAGLGTPRPPIRLEDQDGSVRLVEPSTGRDLTDRMQSFLGARLPALDPHALDGYILKKNSPSCGLERIRVYRQGNVLHKRGRGLLVEALARDYPSLPLEEEGRLNDPPLRENFLERVFARNRWRVFLAADPTPGKLVEFHTAHKLLLLAHNEAAYRRMGRLVARVGEDELGEVLCAYSSEFHLAMRHKATPRRHANVLQHAFGHLKTILQPAEKAEILSAIDDYHRGQLPLIVPVTLLRFNVNKYGIRYLQGQLYFDPSPKELMLRNHV